ncbi:rho GTPase-activating protein 32-like [Tupaia chinensis]|uniref:rho GTPase-activating protein 32-like n=1 Tax=Tupaia chinensis TaxID=246437 RepID=UPI000FFC8BB2|nr:rho GTPase-activating protein 32-like [Tupaia chinensis]
MPRKMKSSVHSEEDDLVPELHRNVHPRERPDWEEALSAMARGADVPEIPGDLTLKTCSSTASMKVKHVKKLPFTKGHFPKMAECAHFHYENVEFGSIQVHLRCFLRPEPTPVSGQVALGSSFPIAVSLVEVKTSVLVRGLRLDAKQT